MIFIKVPKQSQYKVLLKTVSNNKKIRLKYIANKIIIRLKNIAIVRIKIKNKIQII